MAMFLYFKTTIKPPEYPKLSDLFQIRNCPCCILSVQFCPSGTRHSPLFSYHPISSPENPISSPCFTNSIMAGAADKPQWIGSSFLLVRPAFFFLATFLLPPATQESHSLIDYTVPPSPLQILHVLLRLLICFKISMLLAASSVVGAHPAPVQWIPEPRAIGINWPGRDKPLPPLSI